MDKGSWLSSIQAAEIAQVTTWTIYQWARQGKVDHTYELGRLLLDEASLRRHLETRQPRRREG